MHAVVVTVNLSIFMKFAATECMFLERAKDYLEKTHGCTVVEGIISPAADSLGRPELIPAKHRLKMVELAVKSSTWIRADGWECSQGEWIRTLHVLHHFKRELVCKYGEGLRLMLLCGGDVLENITEMAVSDIMLWNPQHMEEAVRDFGMVVVARANSNPAKAIYLADMLRAHQKNIHVIEDETYPNDVSSTRLRTAIRRKESIRYCINDEVIKYIEENCLYENIVAHPMTPSQLMNQAASSPNIPADVATSTAALSDLLPKQVELPASKETQKQLAVNDSAAVWCQCSSSSNRFHSEAQDSFDDFFQSLPQRNAPILDVKGQCSKFDKQQKEQRGVAKREILLHSPDYDNVTLEDLFSAGSTQTDYTNHMKGVEASEKRLTCGGPSRRQDEKLAECEKSSPMCAEETKSNECPKMEDENMKERHTSRSIRFSRGSVSRSAEDLKVGVPQANNSTRRLLCHAGSEREAEPSSSSSSNITLTYRKYKLISAPETTV